MTGFKGYGRMLFWGGMVVAVWAGQQSGMLSGSSNAAPAPAQNVAFVATFDERMSTARVKAQHSLPAFLTRMARGDTRGWEGPAVKVAIPGTHQVENIWVADILPGGEGAYTGRLSNDPVNLDGPKRGDRVAFGADQMVDWTVTPDWIHVADEHDHPGDEASQFGGRDGCGSGLLVCQSLRVNRAIAQRQYGARRAAHSKGIHVCNISGRSSRRLLGLSAPVSAFAHTDGPLPG